jgi:hypothetical protein
MEEGEEFMEEMKEVSPEEIKRNTMKLFNAVW